MDARAKGSAEHAGFSDLARIGEHGPAPACEEGRTRCWARYPPSTPVLFGCFAQSNQLKSMCPACVVMCVTAVSLPALQGRQLYVTGYGRQDEAPRPADGVPAGVRLARPGLRIALQPAPAARAEAQAGAGASRAGCGGAAGGDEGLQGRSKEAAAASEAGRPGGHAFEAGSGGTSGVRAAVRV